MRDLLLTAGANSTTTDVDTIELTRDIQRLAVRSRRLESDEREDDDDDDDDDRDARVRLGGQRAYVDSDAEPHTRVYDDAYDDDNDNDGDMPVPDADADAEPTSPVIVKGRAVADLAEDTF